MNFVLLQLFLDDALHFGQKRFAFFAARLDGIFDLVVGDGIDVLKGQVFELAANFAHAQAMGDGRVDIERLARNFLLPLRREELQRAHVVQAVGQLDQHHANVVHHGQYHLADVLGLRFFGRGEVNFADLGDAFDDVGNLLAEFRVNLVDRDRGVFDHVVQQAGRDRRGVQAHLRQNRGYLQRMRQVWFAGLACRPFVMLEGKLVGFLDQRQVFAGAVGADLAQKVAKAGDR